VKASEEQIARSLEGNWKEDLLFVLKQEQDGYEFCEKQMAECDRQLNHYLKQTEDRSHGAPLPEEKRKGRRKKKSGNKPQFVFRMSGTDLTRVDGIDVMTATPTNNRVTIALKMAASTLRQSDTYLGAQFRRFRTRLGAPVAIKAMAAKLARLVYSMLCYGMKYVDQGAALYQAQHRQLRIKQLNRKAISLGYQLIRVPAA
jgi:transposase